MGGIAATALSPDAAMEEDDKTVILPKAPRSAAPLLEISCQLASGEIRTARIDQSLCIGRDPSCRVRFKNERVSRRHTEVHQRGNAFVIVDLGSTNGTKINGTRIDNERTLADGDIVSVGSTHLRFEAT